MKNNEWGQQLSEPSRLSDPNDSLSNYADVAAKTKTLSLGELKSEPPINIEITVAIKDINDLAICIESDYHLSKVLKGKIGTIQNKQKLLEQVLRLVSIYLSAEYCEKEQKQNTQRYALNNLNHIQV